MHPAASIILFTTFSGMGMGLIAFLSLGLVSADRGPVILSAAIAIVLSSGGLVASLFHLGHPERAFRALTQWRSSWLSREGVFSIATLSAFGLLAAIWLFFGTHSWVLGIASALLAVVTVYATAMIYGSLRAVPVWNQPLTPACYLAFSAAGGALLAALLSVAFGAASSPLHLVAAGALVVAWLCKLAWWQKAAAIGFGGSTPETATGLGAIGRVRLFEAPHTGTNYLMREMVCVVGRRHARKLRQIALVFGGALPLICLLLSLLWGGIWPLLLLAVLGFTLGMLAERWLFFAEARHSVALYYGHHQEDGSAHGPATNRGDLNHAG